jgi:hypothetical protein
MAHVWYSRLSGDEFTNREYINHLEEQLEKLAREYVNFYYDVCAEKVDPSKLGFISEEDLLMDVICEEIPFGEFNDAEKVLED